MKKRLPSCGFSFYSRVFVCLLVWLVIPGYSVSIVGKTYTSSNYNISSFIADHNYLWAGTNGEGLIRIDKVTGKTVLFVSTNSGIPDDYIRGLAVDTNGALIVATSKAGVVRFDGNNWEKITGTDESVRSVVTDNYGNIWAWMQSSGIVRYSAGTWQTVVNRFTGIMVSSQQGNVWFFKMPLNPTADCNDGWIQEYENGGLNTTRMLGDNCSEIEYPSCMVVDNKKNCWISSSGTLIKSTDVSFNRFEIKNDTNESRSVTALAVNHDDILLIAVSDFMEKSEIYLYDQKAASQPSFDSSTFSLDVKSIMAACYDKETGDFWCVASDGKILKIGQFKNISVFRDAVSVLPGNSVTSLLTDKHENVWAAVNGGIVRYSKNESWNTFPASGDSIPGRDVSALALDSSGVIWAGFKQPIYMSSIQSGIASFNGEHWRKIQTTHVSIKKVVIDKNNDLWIVSENGVSRITENQDTVVFQTKSSSVRDVALGTMVNTIAFDNNNTPWIGTGLGIKRYENSVWIDDTTLKQFLPQTGILSSGVNVNCLHFDNDTLWIGTSMGLFKRYENTCLHYDTTASMLPDMNVQCIKTNRLNGVWVGTRGGLVQMAGEKHAIYTTDNTPLIDNDITACVVASDGNIWIGTRKGGVTILERSSVASNMSTGTNFKGGSYDKSVKKSVSVSFKKFANSTSVISVQTEQPSSIQFDLYTLQGKKIRSFHVKSSGTGPATICWNGTDRFNRKVASGVLTGVVTINGSIVEKVTISK